MKHFITRKEHDKLMDYKNTIIQNWLIKCNSLKKDIENKEREITNILHVNEEFAIENEYLRNKIKSLEDIIKWHEDNECKLNKELCIARGRLDSIKNTYRITTGEDIEI